MNNNKNIIYNYRRDQKNVNLEQLISVDNKMNRETNRKCRTRRGIIFDTTPLHKKKKISLKTKITILESNTTIYRI